MRLPALSLAAVLAVLLAPWPGLPRADEATLADGRRFSGRLEWFAGRLVFRADPPGGMFDAADLRQVSFAADDSTPSSAETGSDSRRTIRLWGAERITASVLSLDERAAGLDFLGERLDVPRSALSAIVGPPRRREVLLDDFEQPSADWRGGPATLSWDDARAAAGERSLRIDGELDIERLLAEPIAAGEVSLAFFDTAARAAGRQWLVELRFGPRPLRFVLGWDAGRIAVESPSGPSLAVREVRRAEGWRKLHVRFTRGAIHVSVDGLTLAEGAAPAAPLTAVGIVTSSSPAGENAPRGDAAAAIAWIDELRIVENRGDATFRRRDAKQDIVLLADGDELFGRLTAYATDEIAFTGAFGETRLPAAEFDGLYLGRRAAQAHTIAGTIVGVHWRGDTPATDRADASASDRADEQFDYLEGAVAEITDARLLLDHPRLGRLSLPRERLARLEVLLTGRRQEIEPAYHHLGNDAQRDWEVVAPHGPRLELPFALEQLPDGPAWLALWVVELEGVGSPFAPADENAPLRTDVLLNGRRIDYLNRHALGTPLAGVRIRVPLPVELLRLGENRIVFEQSPARDDPQEYDDFGLWGGALEEDRR